MSLERQAEKLIAERLAVDLVGAVVDRLQEMTDHTQLGADSGLVSVWDEFCVEMQVEMSSAAETHVRIINALIRKCLSVLSDHELVALWLITDYGRVWSSGAFAGEPPPVEERDIVRELRLRVALEARSFKNERIETYIQHRKRVRNNPPESPLHKHINLDRAKEEALIYYNPPKSCECCGGSLSEAEFFVDGALRDASAGWSIMCESCFGVRGKGIRWGTGQLYMRQTDGEWLCVGGFR